MEEEFRDILNYEGLYKISNFGRVFSVRNNIYMKIRYNKKGYARVDLKVNGFRKTL